MIIKLSQRPKKESPSIQEGFQTHSKLKSKNYPISQQFNFPIRRHSVYGSIIQNKQQQPFTQRVPSRQLKSLEKHKSVGKHETDKKILQKCQNSKKQQQQKFQIKTTYLDKKSYRYLNMVGKGGFGKVWKVQHTLSGRHFAMKQMSKAIVMTKRSTQSILNQRQLLATVRHRFIVNMLYAFQDQQNLYIIMNLMQGGDLRYHLSKMTVFSEGQTKFMIASILLALEYLHNKMIIHRDVKPQNIVFDKNGYAHLTDLGIAKYIRRDNSEDTSGTPGYMAPEVMFHHNHRYQTDFYAVGVIIYEIMMGKRPYLGKSRQQIKQKIKQKQILIKKKDVPEGWSLEAADFVNKLLQRKPIQRLGWAGIQQVKNHPWLRYFPWKNLLDGNLQSPMKRSYNHSQVRYRPTQCDSNYQRLLNKNKQMLKKGKMQQYFEGYTYQDQQATTGQNTRSY